MKKTLLFSDVHLKVGEADRSHRNSFVAFLRRMQSEDLDRVVCLGDLFDFWFEYRHVIFSAYFDVLRALADMRDAGIEIHLVCGNHDFWAGRFLETELGIHIHRDATHILFGEKRALAIHGDGINPKDRSYRAYRRIARNPLIVSAFRLLHPDAAMGLARFVSRSSRSLKSPQDRAVHPETGTAGNPSAQRQNPRGNPEADALRAYATEVLARGAADIVICGHAHAPECAALPTPNGEGRYINAGDWYRHQSYLLWDGADFQLCYDRPVAMPQKLV